MPQKVDKHGKPLPGFKQSPERVAMIRRTLDELRDKRATKARQRMFQAEPEELKVLDALKSLPPDKQLDAAEGLLIARVGRRKGLLK